MRRLELIKELRLEEEKDVGGEWSGQLGSVKDS